jgi:hypothetical protein
MIFLCPAPMFAHHGRAAHTCMLASHDGPLVLNVEAFNIVQEC